MRIVTWNAQHGGGSRAVRFAERLSEFEADAVVITEFRNNRSGSEIQTVLKSNGIQHFSTSGAPPRMNTVIIGSRWSFEHSPLATLGSEEHRGVRANIGSLTVYGLYFPQKGEKIPVFDALCGMDPHVLKSESLLIGDFNTGLHFMDEVGKTFYAAEYMVRLEKLGWIDAWRSRNPDKKEYSWYSHVGNGFRIDHAFASNSLNRRIEGIWYEHSVRNDGLSDHSALVIDFQEN